MKYIRVFIIVTIFAFMFTLLASCVPVNQPKPDPDVFSASNNRDTCLLGNWRVTGQEFANLLAKGVPEDEVWTGSGEILVSFEQSGRLTGAIKDFTWQSYDPDGDLVTSSTPQPKTEVFRVDDYTSESKWGNVNDKEMGLELVSNSGDFNITVESSSAFSQSLYDLLLGAFKGSLKGMSMGDSGIVSYLCTADKLRTNPETAPEDVFYTRVR